jgi:sterol desaturase/sphingolipid hydroxylase (fatty acid hydroxylase superfamily)
MASIAATNTRSELRLAGRPFPFAVSVAVALCVGAVAAQRILGIDPGGYLEVNGVADLVERLVDWRTYAPVAVILFFEWWMPVEPGRPHLHRATVTDIVWTVGAIVVWIPLVVWLFRGVEVLFDGPLAPIRVDLSGSLPNWALLVIAFPIGELLRWTQHWSFHRVPLLWRFHAVHHSQTDLRLWTEFRLHPLEVAVQNLVPFLPFFFLGGAYTHPVGVLGAIYAWYPRFFHANVRTNMGPLRWIFVTPQQHRVHHSTNPAHFDSNYGNLLCIWDRVFGTLNPDEVSYPPTGIDDASFPLEQDARLDRAVRTYLAQLAHPFRRRPPASLPTG